MNTGDSIVLPQEAFRPMAEVDAPPGIGNLPALSAHFVGREHELTQLDSALTAGDRVVVQAVHGLGGIGKSTLVARWAGTGEHGYAPVWWINADTAASVEQGLARFAATLQPALGQVLTAEQLAEGALQWLATHTGWLLVLDNVERLADIDAVLARAQGGRIVLTSRLATGWGLVGAQVVRVDVLDPDQSVELLTDLVIAEGPRSLEGVSELCAELGYLPLAIEQAGAYLAQNPFLTPADYLGLLSQHPAEMYGATGEALDSERTIAKVWRVTLDRIATTHPAAAEIMRVLAWYAPDRIPVTLLDGVVDQPALQSALGALSAYSMITLDPVTSTVAVHRLVQAVARTPDNDDPQRGTADIERGHSTATSLVRQALPHDWKSPSTWPTWRTMLPHIDVLAGNTDRENDTAALADLFLGTAHFLLEQGAAGRAISYAQRSLTARERLHGSNHPDTLPARKALAAAYLEAGHTAEAITMSEQVLRHYEGAPGLGSDHRFTLAARHNLAYAYQSAGQTEKAITLYERLVADCERVLGPDDPSTLSTRNNLASAYLAADRVDDAVTLRERTLRDRVRVLGPAHPQTLLAANNLAGALEEAGRTNDSIALYERLVPVCEEVLGAEHPTALAARHNLAHAYGIAGQTDEAISLSEQVVFDCERTLGHDHPHSVAARDSLARLRSRRGGAGSRA
ncbi:FxSxx-COOH system tetratricopeptide repeat protein [Nocardia sp. MH4]|uniref:FxSxx-COOH system tetratricopeptide repeat protein n=1 Tax=Nocardia sp. MH4 TaxID=1768677 RepID=UPI001C4FF18B|nr:FxSxx-COOH system tetratricopeptide repeat protein [Nocardia sp. MH4]